jgi:ribulose kinase
MCGLPVIKAAEDATALGAAVLAAVGAGLHSSIKDAAEKMISITEKHNPNVKFNESYQQVFESSINIYENMKSRF